jgi:amino acid transporter
MGGILTTWNAFLIGGSRAIYALARAGQLPRSLGKLHPRYNTPHNAVLLIGALSVISPLFGRPALVWLADAGGVSRRCRDHMSCATADSSESPRLFYLYA